MLDKSKCEPGLPFESASELRKEHNALMEALDRQLERDPSEEGEAEGLARLEPEIRRFLGRGAATGTYLEDISERTACQVMLDYWVSSLSRIGIQASGARLSPFDNEKLPVLEDSACPYVGLEAFRDETNFFGREDDTRELLARIRDLPLVSVVGSSGSGKSSIVMAGVLPALRVSGAVPALRLAPPFVPGHAVLENLANAVRTVNPAGGGGAADDVALLRQDPKHLLSMLGGLPTLITIDQFEEVFTLSERSEREALVGNLAQLLSAGQRHRVILTVRAEFDGRINELLPLAPYLEKARFWMRPMSYDELKAAVEKPAAQVNLQFQPGLPDDLVKKVLGQPAALPLLQFTLHSLWERRNRNRITWEVYSSVGDPLEALEKYADDFYANQIPQTREEIERILKELVWVDELLEAYRQPVAKRSLLQAGKANTEDVLSLLVKHRLVCVTPGTTAADDIVEIQHEALVRNWPRFVGWIDEKRRQRRARLELTQAAKQWEGSKNPEDLYSGWRLQEASGQPDLTDPEKKFIEASKQAVNDKQKEKESALRWRVLAWTFGILAALLICGILLYRYLFVWEYSTHYNEVVRVHGIPVGVGKELKASQYKARRTSLRLVKKGRWGDDEQDLLRMEAVGGDGELNADNNVGTYFDPQPAASTSHECRWEYIRDSRGRIMYEKAYNRLGDVVWILIYSPPSGGAMLPRGQYVSKLYKEGKSSLWDLLKAYVYGQPAEYPQTRDALYLRAEPTVQSPATAPIASNFPTTSRSAVSDQVARGSSPREAGRDVKASTPERQRITFVFSDAKVVSLEYSSKGHEKTVRYYDGDRNPITGPYKAYGVIRIFSEDGMEAESTSIDRDGKPMDDEAGNATLKMVRDGYGNVLVAEAYDASGRPVLVNSGWYKFKAEYDGLGNRKERTYYDLKDNPVLSKDNFCKEKVQYDARGNPIEWSYFGTRDEPVLLEDGYHKVTSKYDEHGNRTESAFYGKDQKPTLYNGFHKVTGKYEGVNQIEWAYFGLKDEPILQMDGFHKVTGKYDERGNRTEWAYFGLGNRPVLHKDGYHRATGKYDERGNRTEWAYFDTEGKPVLHKEGYHKVTGRYDERGNRTEWTYFNAEGKAALHDGYHRVSSKYNKRGNQIEWTYFGINLEPVVYKDGYHKATGTYDERGNRREWAFYDLGGLPVLHKDGYSKVTGEYDQLGNRIEWAFFNPAGKPMLYQGYHRLRGKYDKRGNQIEWTYFGINQEPVVYKDGFHKATGRYDERGNRIEWAFFGTNGKPALYKGYHKETGGYDERGDRTEWAYFGIRGEPVSHEGGYSRVTGKYDERGNRTEWAFFRTNGEPALYKGYHKETGRYDERGDRTEWAYFGMRGEPVSHEGGYSRVTGKYDERGNRTEWVYFGPRGEAILLDPGCHREMAEYDERGNQIDRACLGTDDKPKMNNEGYFRIVRKFDPSGHLLEMRTLDTSGNLVVNKNGFARLEKKYDELGNEIENAAYGTDGKLKEAYYGYARMTNEYDKRGNKIKEAYFDADDRPKALDGGCARYVFKYLGDGSKVEQTCFDTDGIKLWSSISDSTKNQ